MRDWNASVIVAISLFMYGCAFNQGGSLGSTLSGKTNEVMSQASSPHNLSVLSVTGGLCLVAGMVLLVVSRGKLGWYPSIGGLLLVVLNFAIARYSHYLFAPALVFTGMISAAWTYKTVKQILTEKKKK
jgi:hypothetical protein